MKPQLLECQNLLPFVHSDFTKKDSGLRIVPVQELQLVVDIMPLVDTELSEGVGFTVSSVCFILLSRITRSHNLYQACIIY